MFFNSLKLWSWTFVWNLVSISHFHALELEITWSPPKELQGWGLENRFGIGNGVRKRNSKVYVHAKHQITMGRNSLSLFLFVFDCQFRALNAALSFLTITFFSLVMASPLFSTTSHSSFVHTHHNGFFYFICYFFFLLKRIIFFIVLLATP